jgi:prepilin-type N-terminal cleavage/methylation domain-containing protein
MLKVIRKSTNKGFTLIEMVFALAIAALLGTVAVGIFLVLKNSTEDTVAKEQVNTVATSARGLYDSQGTYDVIDKLIPAITEIKVLNGLDTSTITGSRAVSVAANATTMVAVARGDKTHCWYIKLTADAANQFAVSDVTGLGGCLADVAFAGPWTDYKFPPAP